MVVSWGMAGCDVLPAGASTVEFRLTPIPDGTRLDLTHSDLPETQVPGHTYGWRHFMARPAIAGTGADAGSDDWRPLADRAPTAQPRHRTTTSECSWHPHQP